MKFTYLLSCATLVAAMCACSSSSGNNEAAENPVAEESAEAQADIQSITDEDAAAEQVATDVDQAVEAQADKTVPAVDTPKAAPAEKAVKTPVGGDVKSLTNDNLIRPDSKVKKVTILDFNATWCVPCKKFTPAFHEAAKQYGGSMDFYTVDVDQNPQTAAAFNATSIPLVVILRPDGTSRQFVGTQDILPAEKFLNIVKAEFK